MNESVYNLIPPEEIEPERAPMHRSKFRSSAGVAPSYTTFHSKNPKACIVRPDNADSTASRLFARPAATMGHVVGQDIDPKKFIKAHEKHPPLPPVQKVQRKNPVPSRAPVPKREEKHVIGLVTDKDFVTANAVEAILTVPKKRKEDPTMAVHRPTFGKVPPYLESVKQSLADEKEWIASYRTRKEQEYAEAKAQYVRELPEEERLELLSRLQELQTEKTRKLQSMPFSRDTVMQKVRKEAMEKELTEIENAVAKLSKKVVYIYKDDPYNKDWCRSTALSEAQLTALKRSGFIKE